MSNLKTRIYRWRTKKFLIANYGHDGDAFKAAVEAANAWKSKLRPHTIVVCERDVTYDFSPESYNTQGEK